MSTQLFFGSGRRIDIFNFTREDLDPVMIGRGLSNLNRYNGNGVVPMSVGQHTLNLASYLDDCYRPVIELKAALLHDVPELFTGEVTRPVKKLAPQIVDIDTKIMLRMSEVFEVPMSAFDAIAPIDTQINYDERLFIFPEMSVEDVELCQQNKLGIEMKTMYPEDVAAKWTQWFHMLFGE